MINTRTTHILSGALLESPGEYGASACDIQQYVRVQDYKALATEYAALVLFLRRHFVGRSSEWCCVEGDPLCRQCEGRALARRLELKPLPVMCEDGIHDPICMAVRTHVVWDCDCEVDLADVQYIMGLMLRVPSKE